MIAFWVIADSRFDLRRAGDHDPPLRIGRRAGYAFGYNPPHGLITSGLIL